MQKLTYPVLQISPRVIWRHNNWQQLFICRRSRLKNGYWDETTIIDSTGAKFDVESCSFGRISFNLFDLIDITLDHRVVANLKLRKIEMLNKSEVNQCVMEVFNAHPRWVTRFGEKIQDLDREMSEADSIKDCIRVIDCYGADLKPD